LRGGSRIKQLPNILTAARIVFSVMLLYTQVFSPWFFVLYILCGISDFLDGYVARKTQNTSRFGAIFDSVADVAFFGSILIIFIPLFQWPPWILWWIGLIILVRLASLTVGAVKYHSIAFLHTYANKATGLLLFCFPVLCYVLGLTFSAGLICAAGSLSAVEELLINIRSRSLSRNVKSLFAKRV